MRPACALTVCLDARRRASSISRSSTRDVRLYQMPSFDVVDSCVSRDIVVLVGVHVLTWLVLCANLTRLESHVVHNHGSHDGVTAAPWAESELLAQAENFFLRMSECSLDDVPGSTMSAVIAAFSSRVSPVQWRQDDLGVAIAAIAQYNPSFLLLF